MKYSEKINILLKPDSTLPFKVLDLFSGCGGLSLGFESIGFSTIGIEYIKDYCDTYSNNLIGDCIKDTISCDYSFPEADILIGGPPCQPFSVGGKQNGSSDKRDGFPAFIKAVKSIKPKLFLIENVRGLLYKNKWYLDKISNDFRDLGYYVEAQLLNAKYYGIPQNRERVIIIGHKGIFKWPRRSINSVSAGEALESLQQSAETKYDYLTPNMDKYIAKYEKASKCIVPRDLHMDKPARTLTCRNLAGATGDMHRIVLEDGRRRRITVREAARLQSFPDWFSFEGNQSSAFYQIGNAVPPLLAHQLAKSVAEYMRNLERYGESIKPPESAIGSQIEAFD